MSKWWMKISEEMLLRTRNLHQFWIGANITWVLAGNKIVAEDRKVKKEVLK
jgi:hypothetical protein